MTAGDASGWFHHRGWWIDASGADAGSVELASAHESNHRQLAASTAFGNLTLVLDELADAAGDDNVRQTVVDLVSVSEATHEAFATWASVTALGRPVDALAGHPGYLVHWRAAARLVAGLPSPYLRLHGVHALARACMQGDVARIALDVGLDRLVLADIPRALRPDDRFRHLRRTGIDWTTAIAVLAARAPGDPDLARLLSAPDLTAGLFGVEHAERWTLVGEELYRAVAEALGPDRPTLGHDGHLAWSPLLVAASRELAGDGITLAPATAAAPSTATHLALRNVETEGFRNGPLLRARWVGPGTPVEHMVAATGDDAHLFLALLPDLAASYDVDAPGGHPRPVARRTVIDDDGSPTVELLDLSDRDPATLDGDLPVRGLVAMSVLGGATTGPWAGHLGPATTAVLLDRPLGAHLDLWLRDEGARFRHCLILTESFGRRLPVLVARLDVAGAGHTHGLVRPLSDAGARTHRAALEELGATDPRIVTDPTLLEDLRHVLPLVLAHLAGEQTHFPGIER